MNYLLEKKQILELKLALVNLIIEKQIVLRTQQYEKCANLREKEKELLQTLNEKKLELIKCQLNFENRTDNLEEFYTLLSCLNEISICYTPQIHFSETFEEFYTILKADYSELFQLKKDCFKKHQFKEAGQINEQLLEIGRFLMNYKMKQPI